MTHRPPGTRHAMGNSMTFATLLAGALLLASCGGAAAGSTDPQRASSSGAPSGSAAAGSEEPRRATAPPPLGAEGAAGASGSRGAGGAASPSGAGAGASRSPLAAPYAAARALDSAEGRASYYSDRLAGRSTASGEPYRPEEYTAASRDLRFGTVLRVTRQDTGAVTYVRVNDRGPFGDRRRIVDLSRAAAEELDMIRAGVVSVRIEIVHAPAR